MPIGLDLGSSSVKAVVVSPRGRPGPAARRTIATRRLPGGRVEQDPEEVQRASIAALHVAASRGGAVESALGIATQRSTILFWDSVTGRPLTPAYSWQDLRGAARCEAVRRGGPAAPGGPATPGGPAGARRRGPAEARPGADGTIAARTGLRLTPYYSASKLAWALAGVRGLRRRVASGRALWGTLGTFLLWRMTGGACYAIDHANAQRTLLFDLESTSWDPDLFEMFGLSPLLDAPALPALLPTTLNAPIALGGDAPALRLAAMTGDQQAALIGLGCRAEGAVAINYGSGAFVLIDTGERLVRVPGLLMTLLASWRRQAPAGGNAATGRIVARYAVEGPVNAAATAIDWARRRLRLRVSTADIDRFLGPDHGRPRRVHFLPAVAGLGAPRWDPEAAPSFSGDVRGAAPRDLLRAVVESIAYRCAEIVRAAAQHLGTPPGGGPPILAAGGLTRCRTLLQAQADLLQRPVIVRESPDATGLGAALLTLDPAGLWRVGGGPRAGRGGSGAVGPRLSPDEAEARYRAWEGAVYGAGTPAPAAAEDARASR